MKLRERWHRIRHFEYWPFWFFYLPVFAIWPWLALRSRSLVFFTNVNPFIPLGGSIEESKSQILALLPQEDVPEWSKVDPSGVLPTPKHWPVVAKPDVGERGDHVEILENESQLRTYARRLARAFIVQTYVSDPFEAGVMVIRDPITGKVDVTSIVTKGFLTITGDGESTLAQLVRRLPRASFQWDRLRTHLGDEQRVLRRGEALVLEKIGNHCRGTTFIDGNHLWTLEVQAKIESMVGQIQGFYFGRFDLKAPSERDFSRGAGWRILELNGAFSEPGHIYDPGNSLISAWRDLVRHWVRLSDVSRALRSKGIRPSSFREFAGAWLAYRRRTALRVS